MKYLKITTKEHKCSCGYNSKIKIFEKKIGFSQKKIFGKCPKCNYELISHIETEKNFFEEDFENFPFKINDYIEYYVEEEKTIHLVTSIYPESNLIEISYEKLVSIENIKKWIPEPNEYCYFAMKNDEGISHPILMKYGEQDTSMWEFITPYGVFPHYLKT